MGKRQKHDVAALYCCRAPVSAVMAVVKEERLGAGNLVLEPEPKPEAREAGLQREAGGVSLDTLGPRPAALPASARAQRARPPPPPAWRSPAAFLLAREWRAAHGEDVDEETAQAD